MKTAQQSGNFSVKVASNLRKPRNICKFCTPQKYTELQNTGIYIKNKQNYKILEFTEFYSG